MGKVLRSLVVGLGVKTTEPGEAMGANNVARNKDNNQDCCFCPQAYKDGWGHLNS